MSTKFPKFYTRMYSMEIMPEQDFTSYVADTAQRCMTRKTGGNPRDAGVRPRDIGLFYQSNIKNIVDQLGAVLPDVDSVIRSNTRLPLFKPFLSERQSDALYRSHKDGSVVGSQFIRCAASQMAFCPECYETDMDELGYSYWRRAPRMDGLLVCEDHARPYLTFCAACYGRYQFTEKIWTLDRKCICKKPMVKIAHLSKGRLAAAKEVSVLVGLTLRGEQPGMLTGANIVNAVRHHFKKQDLLGYRAGAALQTLLIRTWGSEIAERLNLTSRRFSQACSGAYLELPSPEHPIQALTVVQTVFGDFETFSAAVEEANTEPPFRGHRPLRPHTPVLPSDIKKWREWLRDIKKNHPEVSRTDLNSFSGFRRHSKCMRWDKDWYDKILPSQRTRSRGDIEERSRKDNEKIKELKRHIVERYHYSIRTWPLKRVATSYLYRDGPHGTNDSIVQSPAIKALLDKYLDTDERFARRCAKFFRPLVKQYSKSSMFLSTDWWLSKKSRALIRNISYAKQWLRTQQKIQAGSR